MIEAFVGLVTAIITLAVIALPGLCLAWLIISLAKKYIKPRKSNKPKQHTQQQAGQYQTGWRWNEEKKLWEPPDHLKSQMPEEPKSSTGPAPKADEIDYRNAYQSRQLFTRNEWQNYKKLRDIAEVKGYVICPKVRLWDIIEPRRGEKKYKTLQYKIQAKHVDFVICDQDMHIKAIIELDDNSHNNAERKARDEFVDLILRSVGYKVIHTRYITNDILDLI